MAGRRWEMERMRQSERRGRARKRISLIVAPKTKNQSSHSRGRSRLCAGPANGECDTVESNFVHLLILFILFLHQLSIRETGFMPVDGRLLLAKVREWGWRYGCVGSGGLLCAFGGVTCAAHCGCWCTEEICIHLVIPAGGTDDYLTLILQRPVQRKRDLDCVFFLFFPLRLPLFRSYCWRSLWRWCPHLVLNVFLSLSRCREGGKHTDWVFLQHNIISASIPARDGWLNKALNKPGVDWCIQAMHYSHHQ